MPLLSLLLLVCWCCLSANSVLLGRSGRRPVASSAGAAASAATATESEVVSSLGVRPLGPEAEVEVRPAGGKGMGAFAVEPIAEGTWLGNYQGVLTTQAETTARYGDDAKASTDYLMTVNKERGLSRDARNSTHFSKFMNHAEHGNLELRCDQEQMVVDIYAARDIAAGEVRAAAADRRSPKPCPEPTASSVPMPALTRHRTRPGTGTTRASRARMCMAPCRRQELTFDYGVSYWIYRPPPEGDSRNFSDPKYRQRPPEARRAAARTLSDSSEVAPSSAEATPAPTPRTRGAALGGPTRPGAGSSQGLTPRRAALPSSSPCSRGRAAACVGTARAALPAAHRHGAPALAAHGRRAAGGLPL